MLPHDTNDLIVSVVLFALFVSAGIVTEKKDFFKESVALKEEAINDDVSLLLLNYLKTETDNGKISDLILESENDEEKFRILEDETENILNFALVESYDIRIIYFGEERRINNDDLDNFKEMKMPSSDGNIITVKMNVVFREDR